MLSISMCYEHTTAKLPRVLLGSRGLTDVLQDCYRVVIRVRCADPNTSWNTSRHHLAPALDGTHSRSTRTAPRSPLLDVLDAFHTFEIGVLSPQRGVVGASRRQDHAVGHGQCGVRGDSRRAEH